MGDCGLDDVEILDQCRLDDGIECNPTRLLHVERNVDWCGQRDLEAHALRQSATFLESAEDRVRTQSRCVVPGLEGLEVLSDLIIIGYSSCVQAAVLDQIRFRNAVSEHSYEVAALAGLAVGDPAQSAG